jgi:hypothetical protein
VHRALLHGRDLLVHTRHIEIFGGWESQSPRTAPGDLTSILSRVVNLKILRVWSLQDFTSPLVVATQACGAGLRTLHIQWDVESTPSALFHIRLLHQLEVLEFSILKPPRGLPFVVVVVDKASYWDMPFLHTLHVQAYIQSVTTVIASFLGRSQFPSLRTLKLSLEPGSSLAAEAMAHFLAQLTLENLELDVEDAWQPIILPRLSTTSLEVWADSSLGLVFWDHIAPSVKELYIVSPDEFPQFWASLDRLLEVHERIGTRDIHLNNWRQMRTWVVAENSDSESEDADPEPEIAQKLLKYAALLAQRGINLRDGHGKTVTDYFK